MFTYHWRYYLIPNAFAGSIKVPTALVSPDLHLLAVDASLCVVAKENVAGEIDRTVSLPQSWRRLPVFTLMALTYTDSRIPTLCGSIGLPGDCRRQITGG